MPAYSYKAFNASGEIRIGRVEAATPESAEASLALSGLTVFEVVENGGPAGAAQAFRTTATDPWWRREIGRERTPRATELARFAGELSMFITAGISIDQALLMLSENGGSGFQLRVSERLRTQVLEGMSLSDAMKAQSQVFSDELTAIVSAAEASADLPGGLSRIASLLGRRAQMQSELRSALIYPAVLLAAAIGVLLVVINVLIPTTRPLFDEARAPMPWFIKFLDDAQSFIAANIWALGAIALLAAVALRRLIKRPYVRRRLDELWLRVPVIEAMIRRLEGARFARTLGAQVVAGVSLLPALSTATEAVRNSETKRRIAAATARIKDGAAPSLALRENNPFPPLAYQLIAVGEGSGRLGPVLLQLADTFEQAQQMTIKRTMSLLTPLLTLGLGLLVGALMLSLMSAITGLNDFALR
jgi:general secretion pathway protein F